MNGCPPSTFPQCGTIQVIEPDPNLPVGIIPPPGFDQAITEQGDVILSPGQTIVSVQFATPKAGDYRFEYLYIDTVYSSAPAANPGAIAVVPVTQSIYGFSVDLAGYQVNPALTYTLHWRVVCITFTNLVGSLIDAPESLYLQLPMANEYTASFVNPRSDTDYGFSELRVENLTDPFNTQSPIQVQVAAKTLTNFTVAIYPVPPNNNYYLVARTP